jgi:hypothetical protein
MNKTVAPSMHHGIAPAMHDTVLNDAVLNNAVLNDAVLNESVLNKSVLIKLDNKYPLPRRYESS